MLELLAHALVDFFLVLGLLWVVEKHAVFLTNELHKEGMDVSISFEVGVQLAVGIKATIEVGLGLVGSFDQLSRQILHFLLQDLVVGLENNRVLRQDFLGNRAAGESALLLSIGSFDFLLLLRRLIARDGIEEDSLGIGAVARVAI